MAKQRKKVSAKKKPRPVQPVRSSPRRAIPAVPAARRPAPKTAKGSKKPAPQPAAPKKSARKPVRTKAAVRKPEPRIAIRKPAAPTAKGRRLTAKQLAEFRRILLNLRDSIVDEISFLTGETLNNNPREAAGDLSNYGLHMADQGTDNFDREFSLTLASNEQDVLYEIDEALHRLDDGSYGICEQTGQPIEIERLRVLPYARLSRAAQEELERHSKRRRMPNPSAPVSYEEEEPQEE